MSFTSSLSRRCAASLRSPSSMHVLARPRASITSSLGASVCRRFASSIPNVKTATPVAPRRGGTWKGTVLRWGLAAGAVYWYNTSPLFAEYDDEAPLIAQPAPSSFSDADLETVDAIIEQKRKALRESTDTQPQRTPAKSAAVSEPAEDSAESVAALEAEAGTQGAYNPETGEINWDCPCLGGMANGPCGEEFKTAFSCFVHSTEEPKGADCIEKFVGMQECFRKYPEIYGDELADNEGPDGQSPSESSPPAETTVQPASTSSEDEIKTPAEKKPKQKTQTQAKKEATATTTPLTPSSSSSSSSSSTTTPQPSSPAAQSAIAVAEAKIPDEAFSAVDSEAVRDTAGADAPRIPHAASNAEGSRK